MTASNDEDGVAVAIEEFILGEGHRTQDPGLRIDAESALQSES